MGSSLSREFAVTAKSWLEASATEIARAIRERIVTCEEVVEAHLARIDEVNPGINALVTPNPRAREEARAMDAAVSAGRPIGPLHGVPFSVKDVLDVAGLPAACGVPERTDHVPTRDAICVARVREAGAVLLGKTNCPALGAGGVTDNELHGRTDHPLDATR